MMDDRMKQDFDDIALLIDKDDDDKDLIHEGIFSKETKTVDVEKEREKFARRSIVEELYSLIVQPISEKLNSEYDSIASSFTFKSKVLYP